MHTSGFLLVSCPDLHFVSTLTDFGQVSHFPFLLLSLIPLRVYVQIEIADKNLRVETHLLCGAHPQLCHTATSENQVQQHFQLFKVCLWPSRSISANDACADRGRSD